MEQFSFQSLLSYVPLHQLNFITALPDSHIYYENVVHFFPKQPQEKPTLIIIDKEREIKKFTKNEASLIVQDANIVGMVFCQENYLYIDDSIVELFEQCDVPIVQLKDLASLPLLVNKEVPLYAFHNLSEELFGMKQVGFLKVALQIANGLKTPILCFNDKNELIWQTGEEELQNINGWIEIYKKWRENDTLEKEDIPINDLPFEFVTFKIANVAQYTLLHKKELNDWQRKYINKFIGLYSLFIQNERMVFEQLDAFKEHFLYDLLYHKFESKSSMVKQGKVWGWNLEKPHYLMVIDVSLVEVNEQLNWLNEMVDFLEKYTEKLNDNIIVLSFREQILLLVEDKENRTVLERRKFALNIGQNIVDALAEQFSNFEFKVGIGKWYQDSRFLNKSYQEAKIALRFGGIWYEEKNVFHLEQLGIIRVLIHVHQEILSDFCEEYSITQLVESDEESDTEYMHTLKMFFKYKGVITQVADALYVHPNTLRKRLKKIEDITGTNLQDQDDYTNLMIAMRLYYSLHA